MDNYKSFRQLRAITENALSNNVFNFSLPANTRGVLKDNGDLDITTRAGKLLEHLGFFMEYMDDDGDKYFGPYRKGDCDANYIFVYNLDFSDVEAPIVNPDPEQAKDVNEFAIKMANFSFFHPKYLAGNDYKKDIREHDLPLSEIKTPLAKYGFRVLA